MNNISTKELNKIDQNRHEYGEAGEIIGKLVCEVRRLKEDTHAIRMADLISSHDEGWNKALDKLISIYPEFMPNNEKPAFELMIEEIYIKPEGEQGEQE